VANEDSVSVSLSERVERSSGREFGFDEGSGRGILDGDVGASVSLFFAFCLFLSQLRSSRQEKDTLFFPIAFQGMSSKS